MNRQFSITKWLVKTSPYVVLPMLTALAGCMSSANQEQLAGKKMVTVNQLAHHRWVLKTIDGEPVLSNPMGTYGKGLVPELDFGEAQHVGGYAGCNQFSGQFTLNEQGQFKVEKLATTMMMCPESAMHLEQRYAQLLSQWSDIAIDGNVLRLKQGEQVWLFNLFDWVQ